VQNPLVTTSAVEDLRSAGGVSDIVRPVGLRHGYHAQLERAQVPGLFEAGDQWAGSSWAIGPHTHLGWELYLQLDGDASHWIVGGKPFAVGALQMLVVPPLTTHELLDPRPARWHFYFASFDPALILSEFGDSLAFWGPAMPTWFGDASRCRESFSAFLSDVTSTGQLRADSLRASAQRLLISVSSVASPEVTTAAAGNGLATHPAIARAQSLLLSHYADDLPMSEVAARVGLSPAHFASLFTREIGVPPATFRRGLRLEHAGRLLRETGLPVSEIATSVGFCSAQHLATTMHRELGSTPSQVRASASGVDDSV
jgi:AraC-like DNA-binding protein